MNRSETIIELTKSLVAFQAEVSDPIKNAENKFNNSKYATLDELLRAIRPLLAKNNLSFLQSTTNEEGYISIVTLLMHTSGEWIESSPLRVKIIKDDPQGAGSAITYARRYSLSTFLGIASSADDDGQVNDEDFIKTNLLNETFELQKQLGVTKGKVVDYMKASFNKGNSASLSIDEINQLQDWLKAQKE